MCGIECDGVAYHSEETARDRDRLRQQVLEDRGWIIHRIWSTDWFKDREGQIERILKLVDESRARLRDVGPDRGTMGSADTALDSSIEPAEETPRTEFVPSASSDGGNALPVAAPYKITPGEGRYAQQDILATSIHQLANAVLAVVDCEAPVHIEDLVGRVASMWGNRAGARITDRILRACRESEGLGRVVRQGDFVWKTPGQLIVRSRAGARITAERICPEEYREAVLMILRGGSSFSRAELTTRVRSLLGFSRTGALLEQEISRAIDEVLADGIAGESSSGIRLRQ